VAPRMAKEWPSSECLVRLLSLALEHFHSRRCGLTLIAGPRRVADTGPEAHWPSRRLAAKNKVLGAPFDANVPKSQTTVALQTEDQKPWGLECFAGDVDFALNDIDRAFLLVGIERCTRGGLEPHFHVEPFREHAHRRCLAKGRSSNEWPPAWFAADRSRVCASGQLCRDWTGTGEDCVRKCLCLIWCAGPRRTHPSVRNLRYLVTFAVARTVRRRGVHYSHVIATCPAMSDINGPVV
jgi:hypothetical protein